MTEQPTLSSAAWEVKEYQFDFIWGWEPPEIYRSRGGDVQLRVSCTAVPGAPPPEVFLYGYADYALETEQYDGRPARHWHVAWKPVVTDRDLLSYRLAILLSKIYQNSR
jgi:hypothetical protein